MNEIILLSGGLDSAVCLAQAVTTHGKDHVLALSFAYGQKHQLELENARKVAAYYQVEYVVAHIDHQLFNGSTSTLLTGNGAIAQQSYAAIIAEQGSGTVDTYVPFRNGLMLSQAAALAYSQQAAQVCYGAHADDAAGQAYPDCTPEFYHAMNAAISAGTAGKVSLAAPLIKLNKAGVVKLGIALHVPFALTRSCYAGQQAACGKCATCRDRIAAFKANNLKDPITYQTSITWS